MKMNPSLLVAVLVLGGLASRAKEPLKFKDPFNTLGAAEQTAIAKMPVMEPGSVEIDQPRYVRADQTTVYETPAADGKPSVKLRTGEQVTLIAFAAPPNNDGWQLVEVNRVQFDENGKMAKIRGWVKRTGITENKAQNAQYADMLTLQETQKAGECRERFATQLKRYVGTPYVWGGTGPAKAGVDCSGLVVAALLEARCTRNAPPRVARDQKMLAKPLDPAKLEKGDLIFRGDPAKHVFVYLGEEGGKKKIIEAQQTGTNVEIKDWTPGGADMSYGDLLTPLGATQ